MSIKANNTNPTDKADAVRSAVGNSALSGYMLGDEWKALANRFVEGEVTIEDMIAILKLGGPAPGEPRDREWESHLVATRLVEIHLDPI